VGTGEIARGGGPATLEGVVQHFIGVVLGAVATFLMLVITSGNIVPDRNMGYLIAVVVGGIVALLWPWVIGLVLVRRHRSREEQRVHEQVEREMAKKG
jgi:hypothetical protein